MKPYLPTTGTINAATTLEGLSRQFYGTPNEWRRIRDANAVQVKWGSQTPLVRLGGYWRAGAKIQIPQV